MLLNFLQVEGFWFCRTFINNDIAAFIKCALNIRLWLNETYAVYQIIIFPEHQKSLKTKSRKFPALENAYVSRTPLL